jgi:hypothetical protein
VLSLRKEFKVGDGFDCMYYRGNRAGARLAFLVARARQHDASQGTGHAGSPLKGYRGFGMQCGCDYYHIVEHRVAIYLKKLKSKDSKLLLSAMEKRKKKKKVHTCITHPIYLFF